MNTDLNSLLERVRAATEPDRELDADLDVALRGGEIQWRQANYTMDLYPVARRPSGNHLSGFEHEQVPLYTSSLDASLALLERVLPGCGYYVAAGMIDGVPGVGAAIFPDISATKAIAREAGATPALALLAAILSAKLEESK